MAKFIGNIIARAKIECVTGLHIGAGKDTSEIGGVDSPVVRDPVTRLPYIPGSSLKGKLRSLLEFAEGKVGENGKGNPHTCPKANCKVCRPFGSSAAEERTCGPTRLLLRDAHPDEATRKIWDKLDTDLLYTEVKSENFLDRITSAANPRFIERVVKGSVFDLEMMYGVYQVDGINDLVYFDGVVMALRLFEDSTLGGSGSRGYGQVKLRFAPLIFVDAEDYRKGGEALKSAREWPKDTTFTLPVGEFRLDRNHPVCKKWDEILKKQGEAQP
jgi:CRISPR-associated protein Csm3